MRICIRKKGTYFVLLLWENGLNSATEEQCMGHKYKEGLSGKPGGQVTKQKGQCLSSPITLSNAVKYSCGFHYFYLCRVFRH